MSEIRVNNVIADNGLDAVNFSKGINVSSGIITATSFEATTFSKTPTNTPAFHAWSNNVTSHSCLASWLVEFLNSETFDLTINDNSTSGTTANRFTVPSGKGGFIKFRWIEFLC